MYFMRTFLKPLSFLPALLLMYMIFTFSAQEGDVSSALSYKVSYHLVEAADNILDAGLEEWEIQNLATRFHGVTRKIAHMAEYFALAVAVSFPLYVYGLHGILLMLVAGFICVAFACGDEYHQSFVAGRSPSTRDVLIDSFGVFWGIILVRIIGWTGRKTIFRPLKKKRRKHTQEEYQEYYTPQAPPPPYYQQRPQRYQGPYASQGSVQYQQPYPPNPPQGYQQPSVYPPPKPDYGQRQQAPKTYYQTQQPPRQWKEPEDRYVSDHLSEDMSFKKLVRNLKDQKKNE